MKDWSSLDLPVASIALGGLHSLALDPGGEAYGWGSNAYGQLGVRSGDNDVSCAGGTECGKDALGPGEVLELGLR